MEDDWTYKSIGDLGKIVTGKTPSSKIVDAFDGQTPFITPRDMDGRKWIRSTERYLSPVGVNAVEASLVPKRSIAVSCIGSDMGKAVLVDRSSVTNQQINTIVPNEERNNAEYLYYDLSTRQEELKGLAGGSATPILSKTLFSKVPIRVPSKEVQDRVASILTPLDDKIELNRRMNQTLETMAQAVFKSWFVDFEPVKAKAAAKAAGASPEEIERAAMAAIAGKTEAELAQLPEFQQQSLARTAALFPDSFQESELGEIPMGWNVRTVDEIAERVAMGPFGSSIKVSTFVEMGVPVISGQHLRNTLLEDSVFNYVTPDHAEKLARSNVFSGDIIFTHAGSIGQVSLIPESAKHKKYVLSQRQFYLRCDTSKATPVHLTYFFRSHHGQHMLLANASQVGVPSIARPSSYLKSIPFVNPSQTVRQAFEQVVGSFLWKIAVNIDENASLVAIRDTLLPQLLSGKLEIPKAAID